jgi:hypothetical protein
LWNYPSIAKSTSRRDVDDIRRLAASGLWRDRRACQRIPKSLSSSASEHLCKISKQPLHRGTTRVSCASKCGGTAFSRPGDESARCKVLRALGQRKDFSQCMQQSTNTFNVISHRQERTEPFGPRRCRHGTKSSPRREADVPAELLRALFTNVTKPVWLQ